MQASVSSKELQIDIVWHFPLHKSFIVQEPYFEAFYISFANELVKLGYIAVSAKRGQLPMSCAKIGLDYALMRCADD